MKIDEFPKLIEDFIGKDQDAIGTITLDASQPIDISIFPEEIDKLPSSNNGIYLFFSKHSDELIYVGISTNLSGRIYKHIGKGFSWARNNNKAHFPNATLTDGRSWLSKETKELFENAEIKIMTIGVQPLEASSLLESYIIYYGFNKGQKPELNVEF